MVEFAKFYLIGLLCLGTNGCANVPAPDIILVPVSQPIIYFKWEAGEKTIYHECQEYVTDLPEFLRRRGNVITYQMSCWET